MHYIEVQDDVLRIPRKHLTTATVTAINITKTCLFKHSYSNILKILPPKNENFHIKNSDIFHTSAQNVD